MFKTILVPAGGADTDTPVFETALAVAQLSGAHLIFLHIRLDVRDVIASMAAGDLGASGVGMGSLIDDMEADAAKLQAVAKSAVEAFCAREKILITDTPPGGTPSARTVTAEWRTEIGRLTDSISAYARATDLMVAGRSPSSAGVGGEVLEAGLMDSGRPLLIASTQAPKVPETIAIAWKDTPEAARAVAAALPFIGAAAKVLLVSVEEHGAPVDKSCDRLREMLSWHNPNVSVVRLEVNKQPPVELLLAEVAKSGAGLLVMGGYGHSRLREAVFGGFTQRVLEAAAIPVLMTH